MKAPSCFSLVAVAALSLIPLGAAAADATKTAIPQWRGANAAEMESQVIRTAARWEDFWRGAGPEMPRLLDAATEMAVVVSAGQRPSGGFVVKIADAFVENDKLVVVYEVQAPAPGAIVARVITHPWAAAILPRNDRPVVFRPATKGTAAK